MCDLLCLNHICTFHLKSTLTPVSRTHTSTQTTITTTTITFTLSSQVPRNVSDKVMVLFESLGMMSSDYPLLDYLKGHAPANIGQFSDSVVVSFPVEIADSSSTSESKSAVQKTEDIAVPLTEMQLNFLREDASDLESDMAILKYIHELTKSNESDEESKKFENDTIGGFNKDKSSTNASLISLLRSFEGLRKGVESRVRITILRLKCFYVLLHSRMDLDQSRTASFFLKESNILKDLVVLSDISSETMEELQIAEPFHLGKIVLECTTGMLETSLRRRNQLFDRAGITAELGLSRLSDGGGGNGTHESTWSVIVTAACSVATRLFDERDNQSEDDSSTEASMYGTYVRIGLELFITCLITRDPTNAVEDAPVVGAIVGFLQASVPTVQAILQSSNEFVQNNPGKMCKLSKWDSQVMWTVAKGLVCVSICIQHNYATIVRECDTISLLTTLIESFTDIWTEDISLMDSPCKGVLDGILDILCDNIDNSRRSGFGEADNGVQIIHQPCFSKLCMLIFKSPYKNNEYLWIEILSLIKESINAEPTFLGQFLRSDYIVLFKNVLKSPFDSHPLFSSPSKLEPVLLPLSKLAYSMCITTEGQDFVIESKIPELIVEANICKSGLLPHGDGFTQDTILRCGTSLAKMMRESEQIQEIMNAYFQLTLINVCEEARSVHAAFAYQNSSRDMHSERMQVLQKLSNLCYLIENLSPNYHKRNNSSNALRDILTENVVEALIRAYPCILPPMEQLMSQLGVRMSSGTITSCGYHPTGRAITSVLKLGAQLLPHVILPAIFRIVDENLSAISSAKSALRLISISLGSPLSASSASSMGTGDDISGGGDRYDRRKRRTSVGVEEMEKDMMQEAPPDRKERQRRRSRGSSLGGEGTNVLILGILDSIPNLCINTVDLLESELYNEELLLSIWKLVTPILTLEWYTMVMSYCLRPSQKLQGSGPNIIANGKDVLRRLFAFHRSSMLEVCRFSSSKWDNIPIDDCRATKSVLDTFATCDSFEDEVPILRTPTRYLLRVVSANGAIIREDCEFENSRIVLLATVGTTCVAYERSQTTGGVIRYRTEHGWLSEFRRDHQREPIVEVLNFTYEPVPEHLSMSEQVKIKHAKDVKLKRLSEALTMRETVGYSMVRIHATLRQVGVYLSRSTMADMNDARRFSYAGGHSQAPSPSGPMLANSLSKIIKGFILHPFGCLDDSSQPSSFDLVKDKVLVMGPDSGDSSGTPVRSRSPAPGINDSDMADMKKAKTPSKAEKVKDDDSATTTPKLDRINSTKKGKPPLSREPTMQRVNSKESISQFNSEDDNNKELVSVSSAAVCLYHGAVVRHMVLPLLEDRNGNLNTYLLRTLMHHKNIDALLNAFYYLISVLHGELKVVAGTGNRLRAAGCCAINAIPQFTLLFSKLLHHDACFKSPITEGLKNFVDDLGRFDANDLAYNLVQCIATKMLPICTNSNKILKGFPSEIQRDFIALMGDLLQNLNGITSRLEEMKGSLDEFPLPHPASPSSRETPYTQNRVLSSLTRNTPPSAEQIRDTPLEASPGLIAELVTMNFTVAHIRQAVQAVNSLEPGVVVDWLIANPAAPLTNTTFRRAAAGLIGCANDIRAGIDEAVDLALNQSSSEASNSPTGGHLLVIQTKKITFLKYSN